MSTSQARYRVAADFTDQERDALDALCTIQYRPPAEMLRWLVMNEARKRGLLSARKNESGASTVVETQAAAL